MRPKYETENDLANERRAMEQLCNKWGATYGKLSPTQYIVDFAIYKQKKLAAFAEYKRRRHNSDTHGTVMLAASKVLRMLQLAEAFDVPVLFVVEFDDCVMWKPITKSDARNVRVFGRDDRGDEFDIEPCCLIAASQMNTVFLTKKENHA